MEGKPAGVQHADVLVCLVHLPGGRHQFSLVDLQMHPRVVVVEVLPRRGDLPGHETSELPQCLLSLFPAPLERVELGHHGQPVGLLACLAAHYVQMKYAKLYALERAPARGTPPEESPLT